MKPNCVLLTLHKRNLIWQPGIQSCGSHLAAKSEGLANYQFVHRNRRRYVCKPV